MAVIPGTPGADTLVGTAFEDTIQGGDGNDVLSGRAAADALSGDAGADTLNGEDGDDVIIGGVGADVLTGGLGNDALSGGADADTFILEGAFGVDTIVGADGNDTVLFRNAAATSSLTLNGASGIDLINFSSVTLSGTALSDRFDFSGVTGIVNNALVDLLAGNDTFAGSFAGDNVTGGAGNDSLSGGSGNDTLEGGAGSDRLLGGDGDDRLVSSGAEALTTFAGGAGTDTVALVAAGGPTSIARLKLDAGASVEILRFEAGGGLTGTSSGDTFDLRGVTSVVGGQQIDLQAGSDSFTGSQAADSALGGLGNDTLSGGSGADTLEGGAGSDKLLGGDGDDRFVSSGAEESTTFAGGTGADTLALVAAGGTTSISRLKLDAAASVETLRFEAGGGLTGTASGDVFNLSGVTTVANGAAIDLLAGDDSFVGTQQADSVRGGAGNDQLDGGLGNDTLDGGAGNDKLLGGDGDDVLNTAGLEGFTTFAGGAGADRLVFLNDAGVGTTMSRLTLGLGSSVETIDFTVGSLNGTTGSDRFDLRGVTTVTAAKSIVLLEGNDSLVGTQAADIADGGAGNDTLDGGVGADSLTGGLGNDTFVVDAAGDSLVEAVGAGTDLVRSSVSYTLAANIENLQLTGAALNGTGNALANTLTGNASANALNGGAGADKMLGGVGDDVYTVDDIGDNVTESTSGGTDTVQASVSFTLGSHVENLTLTGASNLSATGNKLANTLTGNAGDNLLNGGAGADTLAGLAGDDNYVVDVAGDVVTEAAGAGTDLVTSSISWTLGANVENLTLTGSRALNGDGNGLANTLTGNNGANLLDGGAGADALQGLSGSDVYVVDNAGDVVTELSSGGTDRVQSGVSFTLGANVENLTLTGTGAINATGNAAVNALVGNTGANRIDGGLGSDALTGGAGADTFTFSTTLGRSNVDTVTDFVVADDTIALDDLTFFGLDLGALTTGALVIGAAAADDADRVIYNSDTGGLFFDRDGTGSAAAVRFATLDAGLLLTDADFSVV